jgi:hypothetical protein
LLPLKPEGEFARGLRGRAAALELDRRLRRDPTGASSPGAGPPELDIVVWKLKRRDRRKLLGTGAESF